MFVWFLNEIALECQSKEKWIPAFAGMTLCMIAVV